MAPEILAPLAGKVLDVLVAVGDTVEADEETFIIEAMKMETPVFALCDGTLKEIRVNKDDIVNEDDVLAVIDT